MKLSKKLVKQIVNGFKEQTYVDYFSHLYINEDEKYCFCIFGGYALFVMSLDGAPLPKRLSTDNLKGISYKELKELIPLSGDIMDLSTAGKSAHINSNYKNAFNEVYTSNESVALGDNVCLNYKKTQHLLELIKAAVNKSDFFIEFKAIHPEKLKFVYESPEVNVMAILTTATK